MGTNFDNIFSGNLKKNNVKGPFYFKIKKYASELF